MESLPQEVDKLFSEWAKASSPGCALAVMKDGKVVYKQGYGMANLEYNIPITPKTIFHVASVSKQFVGMAITLLADEGKFSVDDDIRKYLTDLPDFGHTITIRHLLHHTSGLRDQWELLGLAGWRSDDVIKTEDIKELVFNQQELNFKPNDEHMYSNTGYTLLGLIVEEASGKSLKDYCQETMFEPLGMNHTHFHDDHEMIVENRAYSYYPRDEQGFKHAVLSFATVGASSLFTTVEDLALWEQNFYDATIGNKDAFEQMYSQGVLNDGEQLSYAFGLGIGERKGLKTIEHSGGDAGFRSHLVRFPEQHFSVAILSNLGSIIPSDLAYSVADLYLADSYPEEANKKEDAIVELSEEQLVSKTGLYRNEALAITLGFEIKEDKFILAAGAGFELAARSENIFYLVAFPKVSFEFRTAEDGAKQVHERVGEAKAKVFTKLELVAPSDEELSSYLGVYYSPELDVSYTLLVKDNQLFLKRRKHGLHYLHPTFTDGFIAKEWPSYDIVFQRDEQKLITGFRLSLGRVRNLWFVKQGM